MMKLWDNLVVQILKQIVYSVFDNWAKRFCGCGYSAMCVSSNFLLFFTHLLLFIYFFHLFIISFIYLFIYLFICLFIYFLFIYLFICFYFFIYLFISFLLCFLLFHLVNGFVPIHLLSLLFVVIVYVMF